MIRGQLSGRPRRLFTSEGFTPDVVTLTRTSPGPGSGVSIWPTVSTARALPLRSYQAAFIVEPPRSSFFRSGGTDPALSAGLVPLPKLFSPK
jgi:hypothetical protein